MHFLEGNLALHYIYTAVVLTKMWVQVVEIE